MSIRGRKVGSDIGGAEIVRGEDGRMYVGNQRDGYRPTLDQQRQDDLRARQRSEARRSRRREADVFRSVMDEAGSSLSDMLGLGIWGKAFCWLLKFWFKLFIILFLAKIVLSIFA